MRYFPDFFIIGAPKCGTTAIYNWLSENPQVHAPVKEPSFFSQDIVSTENIPTHISSLEEYCGRFKGSQTGKEIIGEATPKYLYSDRALQKINMLRPDAKLIVCLRDPVDLAISFHNQKVKEGVECEPTFEAAWNRALEADNVTPLTLNHEIHGQINYLFWASVGRRLERLFQYFPRRQVLFVFLSDLKTDPRRSYSMVLEFLGVENDGRKDFSVVNERRKIIWPRFHKVLLQARQRVMPVLGPYIRWRGGKGTGLLKAATSLTTTRGQYTSEVTSILRSNMYRTLRDDMRITERLVDGGDIAGTGSGRK
jgi:hypothetical protein